MNPPGIRAGYRIVGLVVATTVVAAEWLRQPAPLYGWLAIGLAIVAVLLVRRAGPADASRNRIIGRCSITRGGMALH